MNKVKAYKAILIKAFPIIVFLLFAFLTFWFWQQQVIYQRKLLARHTKDVCFQVSRRLQILVESRIQVATIFAKRWSTHENRDFSQKRFNEFASVLINQVPGYHAIHLIQVDNDSYWSIPRDIPSAWPELGEFKKQLLQIASRTKQLIFSSPTNNRGHTRFFAVLPLMRQKEALGHLVVEFDAEELIGAGFRKRIQSEFNLRIDDEGVVLFRFLKDKDVSFEEELIIGKNTFSVFNRKWTVTLVPHKEQLQAYGWWSVAFFVPLLSIFLAVGLSILIYLLLNRIELYRRARDRAVSEIAARFETQEALRISEAKYRSVFDSSTDGLIVVDESGKIIEANPAASAMHGYKHENFIGRTIRDIIAPGHEQSYEEFRLQLDQFGSARLDSVNNRIDGSIFEVEVRGTRFSFGGEDHLLAILTDVSELKRALVKHTMLSRKVLLAQEEERARVSRELHDELGQILTALHLELNWLHKKVREVQMSDASSFDNAISMVEKAADELRHICKGLRPPLLDDLGLEPAVQLLVEEFEERTKIRTDLELQIGETGNSISSEIALSTYRILQESLNNVSRHAQAHEVSISLIVDESSLLLSIYDNGQGFVVEDSKASSGCGIEGMKERAFLAGGIIDIRSERFQGTRITFRVPLNKLSRLNGQGEKT